MNEGLLEQLGLSGIAGFALGVAVASSPADVRPIKEFAREVLAECVRLVGDATVQAALPAAATRLQPSPAAVEEVKTRRKRRTREEIEAAAAQKPEPRRGGRRRQPEASAQEPEASVPEPEASVPSARPNGRRRRQQETPPPAPELAAAAPEERPAPRRRRRQQGEEGTNGAATEPETVLPPFTAEEPAAEPLAADTKINLNTATRGQLMRLPRVGAGTADKIIQFREQQGPIRNVRQLRQADIIPVSAARNMREHVEF
jgi:hypothetical protein